MALRQCYMNAYFSVKCEFQLKVTEQGKSIIEQSKMWLFKHLFHGMQKSMLYKNIAMCFKKLDYWLEVQQAS